MAARTPARRKRAEELADQLIHAAKLARPPVPVERIARDHGLAVRYEPVKSTISGFVFVPERDDEGQPVIGVNSSHPEARQRFTIAHELGHFLLHKRTGLRVDREVFGRVGVQQASRDSGDESAQRMARSEEIEANLFAAALLMPAALLRKEMALAASVDLLFEDRHIRDMARRYGVSIQALMIRLNDLGFVRH